MLTSPKLDWNEVLGLQVVRKVAALAARRWHLGFGYVDAARQHVSPPSGAKGRGPCQVLQETSERSACCDHAAMVLQRFTNQAALGTLSTTPLTITCHAGLTEIAAPIVVNEHFLGALLCGGYLPGEDGGARVDLVPSNWPRLSAREASFVEDLLEEASAEICAYLLGAGRIAKEDDEKRDRYKAIIGSAPPMQALYSLLDRVVISDSTVLVTGANGTGKELVARAIHYSSPRKSERFVVQNCSAFNDNLLDSELFGHKRGAFTGAVADKKGLFEVADKGTFFLDEIGDMSPVLQVKVLRVLQEGTFTPVGDIKTRHVDVRIVAATNRDLKAMVEAGTFREDLYYRINVIPLSLPSLRDRMEDLEVLAKHFLAKHEGAGKRFSAECLALMRAYPWPGNVRELENEIERLVVLSGPSSVLTAELLSTRMRQPIAIREVELTSVPRSLPDAVKALERRMIRAALIEHNWNKTRAAAQLQVSRRNLIRLVQKYELDDERASVGQR